MGKQILHFLIITGACAALAFGQKQPFYADSSNSGRIDSANRRFMQKAAEGGLAEVKLGQLAADKASNQAVKDFGKRMVTDHTKINDQLKGLASQKGVNLPTSLDAKDQATYDRLSKVSGSEFDSAYMRDMVKDHNADIAEFQGETQTAKDADVKAFAQQTLPTLEDHLNLARQVSKPSERNYFSRK